MTDILFSPSFGNKPRVLVGRDQVMQTLVEGLASYPGSKERARLIIGQRGLGKTVLLLSWRKLQKSKDSLLPHQLSFPATCLSAYWKSFAVRVKTSFLMKRQESQAVQLEFWASAPAYRQITVIIPEKVSHISFRHSVNGQGMQAKAY